MPHDKDRIAQRAGYIESANKHRQYHQDAATKARSDGRETTAKRHETQASNISARIEKAAQNIYEKMSDRKK